MMQRRKYWKKGHPV